MQGLEVLNKTVVTETPDWDGDIWTDVNCEPIDDVLAWMPLPKPYKEGELNE